MWTESSLVSVFKDSQRTAASGNAIELVAARNEYEFGQLALRSNGAFDITSVTLPDLVSGGNRIAASNLRSKYVDYAFIANSSPGLRIPTAQRRPTSPSTSATTRREVCPGNTTQPISVTVFVAPSTPAGTYRGTATVNTTARIPRDPDRARGRGRHPPERRGRRVQLRELHVPVRFPGRAGPGGEVLSRDPQVQVTSGAPTDKFSDDLREHRMNVQWVPTIDLLFDAGSTVAADGTVNVRPGPLRRGRRLPPPQRGRRSGCSARRFLLKRANTYDVWAEERRRTDGAGAAAVRRPGRRRSPASTCRP